MVDLRKSVAEIFPNIVRNILKSQQPAKPPLTKYTEKLNKHVGQDGLLGNAESTKFVFFVQRVRKTQNKQKNGKGDRVRAKICRLSKGFSAILRIPPSVSLSGGRSVGPTRPRGLQGFSKEFLGIAYRFLLLLCRLFRFSAHFLSFLSLWNKNTNFSKSAVWAKPSIPTGSSRLIVLPLSLSLAFSVRLYVFCVFSLFG